MKLNRKMLKSLVLEVMNKEDLVDPLGEAQMSAQGAQAAIMKAFDDISGPSGASQIDFITAENPPGMKKDNNPEGFVYNEQMMMQELKSILDNKGYSYYQIMGDYGGPENSLMVIGDKEHNARMRIDMITLGKQFLQDSIIVGQKFFSQTYENPYDAEGNPTIDTTFYRMRFDMINLRPYKNGQQNNDLSDIHYDETKDLVLRGDDVQARTQFFSKVPGGTKFVIPFFSKQHPPRETVKAEFPVGKE